MTLKEQILSHIADIGATPREVTSRMYGYPLHLAPSSISARAHSNHSKISQMLKNMCTEGAVTRRQEVSYRATAYRYFKT